MAQALIPKTDLAKTYLSPTSTVIAKMAALACDLRAGSNFCSISAPSPQINKPLCLIWIDLVYVPWYLQHQSQVQH